MKIKESQLKKIILEEVRSLLNEQTEMEEDPLREPDWETLYGPSGEIIHDPRTARNPYIPAGYQPSETYRERHLGGQEGYESAVRWADPEVQQHLSQMFGADASSAREHGFALGRHGQYMPFQGAGTVASQRFGSESEGQPRPSDDTFADRPVGRLEPQSPQALPPVPEFTYDELTPEDLMTARPHPSVFERGAARTPTRGRPERRRRTTRVTSGRPPSPVDEPSSEAAMADSPAAGEEAVTQPAQVADIPPETEIRVDDAPTAAMPTTEPMFVQTAPGVFQVNRDAPPVSDEVSPEVRALGPDSTLQTFSGGQPLDTSGPSEEPVTPEVEQPVTSELVSSRGLRVGTMDPAERELFAALPSEMTSQWLGDESSMSQAELDFIMQALVDDPVQLRQIRDSGLNRGYDVSGLERYLGIPTDQQAIDLHRQERQAFESYSGPPPYRAADTRDEIRQRNMIIRQDRDTLIRAMEENPNLFWIIGNAAPSSSGRRTLPPELRNWDENYIQRLMRDDRGERGRLGITSLYSPRYMAGVRSSGQARYRDRSEEEMAEQQREALRMLGAGR